MVESAEKLLSDFLFSSGSSAKGSYLKTNLLKNNKYSTYYININVNVEIFMKLWLKSHFENFIALWYPPTKVRVI